MPAITGSTVAPNALTGPTTLSSLRAKPTYSANVPPADPMPLAAPQPIVAAVGRCGRTASNATAVSSTPMAWDNMLTTTGSSRREARPPRKSEMP